MRAPSAVVIATMSILYEHAAAYNSLFIGHSFFRPIAEKMPALASAAGLNHSQAIVFSGGASGAPLALWNSDSMRDEIQSILDWGNITLFGMTFDHTAEGCELWINYALSKNPNLNTFMIGLPWLDYPTEYDTDSYTSVVRNAAQTNWTDFLEELRGKYPNVTIIDNPYGLSVVELRILQSAGSVPDVTAMTGLAATSLFTDYKGHGGDILKDTASLVWLDRIYHVGCGDPAIAALFTGYMTDVCSETCLDIAAAEQSALYDAVCSAQFVRDQCKMPSEGQARECGHALLGACPTWGNTDQCYACAQGNAAALANDCTRSLVVDACRQLNSYELRDSLELTAGSPPAAPWSAPPLLSPSPPPFFADAGNGAMLGIIIGGTIAALLLGGAAVYFLVRLFV
ncbi:hypothetical protein EMIHUDRAFT_250326 [Emiliania huxleyi CCMP1516]|uniref:ShKT domain-containing protein n=2 Tax=Emiliania huxleyi TaxID=2903 RepID=A0A0D3I1D0_EMIH1|nr:hypothetical protein EMIHUDRAFT_250326 [Emiliania huxleyi CCMP1516]EOD05065.1 hypothetical protein EMIHUDRAFT_250326 [Emiliania huxleyi CCMP1516]|eukprot:XP_005757494.1 hypothetical protein EMIHUDRAFT_250326 [Emiliania huxleyi CCMP1516]